MVFKLVRTDSAEPCKIQLPLGIHLLGRGKFLDCDDNRVSRNHGELNVTDDSVTLKALHHNPCFFIRKGTDETEILKQDSLINLNHGDKFGLLPNSYWYEILHCTLLDINRQLESEREISSTIDDAVTEEANVTERIDELPDSNRTDIGDEEEDVNKTIARTKSETPSTPQTNNVNDSNKIQPISPSGSQQSADSPSLIPPQDQDLGTENYDADDIALANQPNEPRSPAKRSHSPTEETEDVKRVKTEPVYDKQEDEDVKPGPSNNQADASKANNDNDDNKIDGNGVGANAHPSPAMPTGPGRERCMYGANCYRKNPVHKAQYSHPRDPDWGAGPRGMCPWGRGCCKTDPRHWRDHDHPPGVRPPQHRPDVRRKKRRVSDSDSDEASPGLIVTGKRARKTVKRQSWSGSESENEDPYQTDDSEDWEPTSEENTQSQGYTQDLLD